jgi:Undecaprenyl-phosphate galactose phosphotransferase WbaP
MNAPKKKNITNILLGNRSQLVNIVLIILDILTISTAALLSALIRYALTPIMGGEVNWPLIVNGLIFFVIFNVLMAWTTGLYPGFGLASVQEMQKVLYSVTISSIFLGVFLFLQQLGLAYSRFIFVLTWFLSVLFMMLGRFALRNRFSKFSWWGIPVVVVGSRNSSTLIIKKLLENRRLGFRPVLFFDPDHHNHQPIPEIDSVGDIDELREKVKVIDIKHMLFTDPNDLMLSSNFHWMRDIIPNILFVLNSSPFGSLWVSTIDLHGTLVVETNYHLLNKRERFIKRIVDLFLTLLLLLISWPLFLILTLLIKLDSKGPVLYAQKRLGQNGTTFNSLKFRTMYLNAEEKLVELLDSDPQAAKEYHLYHKLANDPRVTKTGKFLRRYSLDELPQLINVVKGDMNLIGPRSYLPRELPAIGDYANIILKVKPGLTGWWQVMGRNATTFEERLQLDEYYISNWSIWLDIFIAIKTIWVLISGQGL